MDNKNNLDVNVDASNFTDDDYHELWNQMGRIRIRMVEKIGKCNHEFGDTFYYENPYKKPEGVCNALLHVLDLYTWRTALGYPSWDPNDRKAHMIHCPAKKGTVWEMKKVPR
jgi:uncharacterized repeat protein (TIGR04076 family)